MSDKQSPGNFFSTYKWYIVPTIALLMVLINWATSRNVSTSLTDNTSIQENRQADKSPETKPTSTQKKKQDKSTNQDNSTTSMVDLEAFEPNPALEILLNDNLQDDGDLSFESPLPNSTFKINTILSMNITGTTSFIPPYKVKVYSNKVEDYENKKPIFQKEITGELDDDVYLFDYKAKMALRAGLYYLLFEEQENNEMYVIKFKVMPK